MMSSAHLLRDGEVLHARALVIGLGAGGGMAFHDLAQAGVDVLAVELGEHVPTQEMSRREEQMLPRLFMEGASRATEDMGIRVLQGKGVGGSTLHNTNLSRRLPKPILDQWVEGWGLDALIAAGEHFEEDLSAVEALLGVHPVPDERVNRNNAILARGREALGWRGGRLSHNREGCKQSGFCELGCPNNGKQHVAKVLIPPALAKGGRVLTGARVARLLVEGGRAVGASCVAIDPRTGRSGARFTVRAERVILSASATNSAALAIASALPDPHALAGTNLHMHPGAFVAGVFRERVESWRGVPQSEDCTEFLSFDHGPDEQRAWIVSGAAHPGAAAGMMPGFGRAHGALMREYPHVAACIVMLHDTTSGRVSPGREEQVRLRYSLNREDRAQLAMGLRQAARIMLAAGAERVLLPLAPARVIRHERELERISASDIGICSPSMVAVHPMSTLWMSRDPRRGVVDARGQHHHVAGLFVADGSLFPTSIGGPPQLSIYAMGRRVARAVRASL